ncbi:uncharacterized protein LOC111385833 [Olea europaea subsp. europaea]|uniref:Uncharacterized protein LOC111385833 n=1 Tax=Olea europaea subsp. europaea TaxID=158383 RepID=A0A8S0SQ85_OLEEU|nr:uncharacterized protein LOC111385833 [Olea europaea subsp. europaea]
MSLLLHLQLFTFCLALSQLRFVASHQESGDWHCEPDAEARIVAEFRPGFVTLDGHADDWADIDGFDFPLRPALDPDEDKEYKAGKMTVKALHDGKDVYFMLQVDGDYVYSKGDNYKCPSVALMFQVGENASYHDMGGCKELPGKCNNKTCRGHEVDIMHFSIGNSIPGRLYGGNNADRIGLVDIFAWNPHCRNVDGIGSADEWRLSQMKIPAAGELVMQDAALYCHHHLYILKLSCRHFYEPTKRTLKPRKFLFLTKICTAVSSLMVTSLIEDWHMIRNLIKRSMLSSDSAA